MHHCLKDYQGIVLSYYEGPSCNNIQCDSFSMAISDITCPTTWGKYSYDKFEEEKTLKHIFKIVLSR